MFEHRKEPMTVIAHSSLALAFFISFDFVGGIKGRTLFSYIQIISQRLYKIAPYHR